MAAIVPPPQTSPIPNYRQQVRRALPDHYFKPDFVNLAWFPVHLGIIAGAWYLLANHFSWWLAPILALVVGHTFACMGFLAHDVAHGASLRNPRMRDILAGIGFSPLWIGPYLWRKWHNADHHNNTQIEGLDPDHLLTMEHYERNAILQFLYRLSPLLRNLVIFGSFSFRMTQHQLNMLRHYLVDKDTTNRERAVMIAQAIAPAAFWIGLSSVFGGAVLVWGYLIPMLVGNFVAISYIATNHFLNPLADERDVLATSLTVTLPKGLRWLDPWHQNFGAHVAHHLFPQAPARHARKIEEKIAELFPDRYHSMDIFKALKLLWDTPWVYENHTTFIDPRRGDREPTLGHGLEKR